MPNPYDKIFKENITNLVLGLSERLLGFGIASSQPLDGLLQTTEEREADYLGEVTDTNGERFVLHLEFQSDDDSAMLYRMEEYHGLLRKKYRLPVRHYVLYFGRPVPRMATELEEKDVFRGFALLDFHRVPLEKFIHSTVPEEVMLGLLADFGGRTKEDVFTLVYHQLKRASKTENLFRRYLKQLLELSRIRKLSKEFTKYVDSMPITIDIENDALYKKGEKKGEKKGKLEEKLETARRMKAEGLDIALISKVTGLTEEEVRKLG